MRRIPFVAMALSACLASSPEEPPASSSNRSSGGSERRGRSSRIAPELVALYERWQREGTALDQSESGFSAAPVRVRDERVLVDCVADGDPEVLAAALAELGMIEIASFKLVVSGWLPIAAIDSLDELDSLRRARAAVAQTRSDSTTGIDEPKR